MISSGWHRAEILWDIKRRLVQVIAPHEDRNGGRCRIRTYDFHRVNELRLGKQRIYE
jgi:hypothetical protein